MPGTADRQYFAIALGWTVLVADIAILGQFIHGFSPATFWTPKWIISIVFALGLFGAGVGLLRLGGSQRSRSVIVTTFGWGFMLGDLILYCFWAYLQSHGELGLSPYSGFLVLFVALIGVAVACISSISKEQLRFPSYGFGIASLLYLFRLIQKYIFAGEKFDSGIFFGELLIVLIGALLFLALYFGSEERANAHRAAATEEIPRGW